MPARYLPPDLYRRILQVVPPTLPPEQRAPVVDLVEAAFGWGYMEGHQRAEEEAGRPTPLVDGRGQRVGMAQVWTNGHAPHPSGQHPPGQHPAGTHRLDPAREPGTVTPLRMGHIADDIALDRLDTDQQARVEAARLGPE